MKYFLVQMKIKTDGSVEKGTSQFDNMNDAVVQFHIAIPAAMQKVDTQKFTAVILDENGVVQKREVYEAPAPADEETAE